MLISLIENLARRQPTTIEHAREIAEMREPRRLPGRHRPQDRADGLLRQRDSEAPDQG